ncbi:hypothetical protein [Streptomyces sp. NPDC047042]|uniref:hypothetical protein n=1 Tax=Streptomyces sp. NPDC047042 TaxID=3154807 RepID=UPI0033E73522
MRIHRTTPPRAFVVPFGALLRQRSLSRCAVGVLVYLLSGVLATVKRRQENRTQTAAALRELEESRYLRRVTRKVERAGQFAIVNEVFGTLCEGGAPAGESEEVRNLTRAPLRRPAPA